MYNILGYSTDPTFFKQDLQGNQQSFWIGLRKFECWIWSSEKPVCLDHWLDQDPEEQGGCTTCVLDQNWIGLWDLILMNHIGWVAQWTYDQIGSQVRFLVSLPILPLGVIVIRKEVTLTVLLVAITGTNNQYTMGHKTRATSWLQF